MVELDHQGFKIEKMQRDMEVIEHHNKQSERYLRSIKSFFGRIANKFSSLRLKESDVKPRETPLSLPSPPSPPSSFPQTPSFVHRGVESIVQQQDEYLDEISNVLGRLQVMGLNMNAEITDQNKRLIDLDTHTADQNVVLKQNNRKIKKVVVN